MSINHIENKLRQNINLSHCHTLHITLHHWSHW